MDNAVIKYVSMIPKEGFEQKEILFKKYEFGGLVPGYVEANKLNGSKPLQEEKLMAINFSSCRGLEPFNLFAST